MAKIGFIGMGNMGYAMLKGALKVFEKDDILPQTRLCLCGSAGKAARVRASARDLPGGKPLNAGCGARI